MFSALRQGTPIYILYKENELRLEIGQVTNVNRPYNAYIPNNDVVNIEVKVNGSTQTFDKVPASLSIANSGTNGVVISEDTSLLSNEVESMINNSKLILDAIPYHNMVLEKGECILKQLNPKFAKEKAQEEKICVLESKMNGIETSLSDMKDMLSKALNPNTQTQ